MEKKDYYAILNVPRESSPEEIKQVYRALAKKLHPDVNLSTRENDHLFQEVQEAYAILSNPKKRLVYDNYGYYADNLDDSFLTNPKQTLPNSDQEAASASANPTVEPVFQQNNNQSQFKNIFSDLFKSNKINADNIPKPQAKRGEDIQIKLILSFDKAFTGTTENLKVNRSEPCKTCNASGIMDGEIILCGYCRGSGQVSKQSDKQPDKQLKFTQPCPKCYTTCYQYASCSACKGNAAQQIEEQVKVTIPGGVASGSKLKLAGKGFAGVLTGAAGDLIITIEVHHHKYLKRKNNDLHITLPITIAEAVFGTNLIIPVIDRQVNFKIPPKTNSGHKFRIKEQGAFDPHNHIIKGDLFIAVQVSLPSDLSEESLHLIRQLDASNSFNPRSAMFSVDLGKGAGQSEF